MTDRIDQQVMQSANWFESVDTLFKSFAEELQLIDDWLVSMGCSQPQRQRMERIDSIHKVLSRHLMIDEGILFDGLLLISQRLSHPTTA